MDEPDRNGNGENEGGGQREDQPRPACIAYIQGRCDGTTAGGGR